MSEIGVVEISKRGTTTLHHQALPSASYDVDYKSIRNEIRRIVAWIVNSD
ncbi:MAG: hypothetical protein QNJ11_17395 [Woeseiaceae bacterium]|nr:hypothetical protein [Woeseiaceae bacterium]